MNKKLIFGILGLCGWVHAGVNTDFLIQNYQVGRISAAMSPDEASKQYPAERVKWWEPYPRVHVIDIDPAASDPTSPPALRLHLDRDQKQIWLIAISDKRYQTSKGIAIGSTFGMLRKAHPRLIVHGEEGEMDRTIVAEITAEGISCVLQFDESTWQKMRAHSQRNVPLSFIPDDKVIQSISVTRPNPAIQASSSGFE